MKKRLLCVGIMLLAAGVALADEEEREEPEHHAHYEHEEEYAEHEREPDILDRNVRLEFMLVPKEDDDTSMFIITASSWFETSTRYENDDIHFDWSVAGHIRIIDDEELFVTVEGHMAYTGNGEEAEFRIESSARVVAGRNFKLASMGDKTLLVRATFVPPQHSAN